MDISQYTNRQGLIDIPDDVISKPDSSKIADAIASAKIRFPTRMMLNGDRRMELFKNLMEYNPGPNVDRNPQNYPTTKWLINGLSTNKYLKQYLTFLSTDEDYDRIDQLTDYFTEMNRLSAYRKDTKISPLQYWEKNMDKLVQSLIAENRPINSKELRNALWASKTEANSFKLTLVSSILWQFKAKRVLDMSAGWGDRLLGSIAHYAERYLGYDPNIALKKGHDEIIEYFTKDRKTSKDINHYEVRYQSFETADLGSELFDLVFTSPPYYDLEVYSDLAGQSIISYPQFEDWLVRFLFVSINKAWNHLKDDGNMVLHISDFGNIHYVEATVLFVLGWCPNASFDGVIGSLGNSKKSRPNWVFHKHTTADKKTVAMARQDMKNYYPKVLSLINKTL